MVAVSTGTMADQVEPAAATTNPCLVPENAGFTGLENQLVRVQIHTGNYDPQAPGGDSGVTPTFLWSRDNASVVGSWSAPTGLVVPVERLGAGGTEGFVAGRWVEFSNEDPTMAAEPGVLAQIDEVVATGLQLVDRPGLSAALTALNTAGGHPIVRAWDSAGEIDIVPDAWLDLTDGTNSDGIQVRFAAGGVWRSGDHWLITARTGILPGTTDRHIDWPVDGANDPLPLPARGPARHVARLGIATRAAGSWTVEDCRQEFAPLTDLITFVGRGGDGQTAPPGHWLVAPLWVGASHGTAALEGRPVRFDVTAGNGGLSDAQPPVDDTALPVTSSSITVTTGPNGMARVWWRLGPGADPEGIADRFAQDDRQTVVATLLGPDGSSDHLPVRFFARAVAPLTLVAAGGDGQIGWPGETLEVAPRARVSAGSRPATGSQVEFEVVSTMDDGTALDQFTGGSIHATAGVVSTELWPGGSRAIRAVVETDADGVAQVQWRLGTEERLSVQRLYAYLLDDAGQRTRHFTIFTSHLAIADEVRWRPCPDLEPFLPPSETGALSVQDALDLFCRVLASGASGRLRWRNRRDQPLNISSVVDLGDFPTIVVAVPDTFDPPPDAVRDDLLELSVQPRNGSLRRRRIVEGSVRMRRAGERTQVEWSIARGSADELREVIAASGGEVTAIVTLRPALFGRANFFTEWSGGFRIRA